MHGVHQRLHLMPRLGRHPIGSSEDRRHAMVRCKTHQEIDLRVKRVREDGPVRPNSGTFGVRPTVRRSDWKHEGQARTRHRQRGILGPYPRLNLGGSFIAGSL
eukprot:6205873-Pleurochrysis_carterae.AAC.1